MFTLMVAAVAGAAIGTAIRTVIARRMVERLDHADPPFRSAH